MACVGLGLALAFDQLSGVALRTGSGSRFEVISSLCQTSCDCSASGPGSCGGVIFLILVF